MKAFRYKDYRPDPRETTSILKAMKDSLIPIDLFKEFLYASKYIYRRLLNKPLPKNLWPNDIPSPVPDERKEKGIWKYLSGLWKWTSEFLKNDNEEKEKEKEKENNGRIFHIGKLQIIVKQEKEEEEREK